MNICLIGGNLTALALAKSLINKKIKVFLHYEARKKSLLQSRTIGISKNNLNFLNKKIIKIKNNMIWDIEKIEIYNEKMKNEMILDFKKKEDKLFSIFKNKDIYELINNNLKKNKFLKKILIKNNKSYKFILSNFDLIINCENNNLISKKIFYKKITKDYMSHAYTTIITHQNFLNEKAVQIFTNKGPIAFLPISNNKTSIVFSKINENYNWSDSELKRFIFKNNKDYNIKKFEKFEKFKLKFSTIRNYYDGNVMQFGDSLHKVHPLAGQGFNMTLRDLKKLSKIIQNKIDLGLNLDHSIYEEFQKETKHYNSVFSFGIDFIYEFFKFDNKYKNNFSNKILKLVGKNKIFNQLFSRYANKGLSL